jgi:hypothetical protein
VVGSRRAHVHDDRLYSLLTLLTLLESLVLDRLGGR